MQAVLDVAGRRRQALVDGPRDMETEFRLALLAIEPVLTCPLMLPVREMDPDLLGASPAEAATAAARALLILASIFSASGGTGPL